MNDAGLNALQFTDTHIYADETDGFARVNTRSSFLATKEHALRYNGACDLVLVTGDLAAQSEAPAYSWLVDQFTAFDAPIFCLPGNHDTGAVMEPLVSAAGWSFGGSHTLGGWHIVLLDSSVQGEAHGRLSAAELHRLDAVLVRHRTLPTLISLHHHPVPMMSAWMDTMQLQNAAALWAVIDKHPQVRGVLWGHVHQNYDAFRNRVRLLATPSTCVQFAARSENFAIDTLGPGYRRLRLSSDGEIDTDVVRI
jgi:Icc protein